MFHMTTDTAMSRMFLKMPVSAMTRPDVLPTCAYKVSQWRTRQQIETAVAYQVDGCDVEQERHSRVEDKHADARIYQVAHAEPRNLNEQGRSQRHNGTCRPKVIQTDERVHPHPLPTDEHLDHDQADGTKDDATSLEHKANRRELNLSERGDGRPGDNEEHVEESRRAGVGDAPDPGDGQDGDGVGGVEHLDEGDGEIKVDDIGADEGEGKADADGDNGAGVDARGDVQRVARVEQGGGAGEDVYRDGGEDEVPARQEDRCAGGSVSMTVSS